VKPELECRLDPLVLADVAGASTNFAHELVDLFVQDSWARVDAMASALEARDGSSLRTVAHTLKGSAGAVGARRLSAICHLLEQHAAAAGDHDTARALVTGIRSELSALVIMFADAKLGTQRRGAA
jgi:histidine phosphotransfer protein HptB